MDTAAIENLNHEWPPQERLQTRRMKVILPQFYAALAIFAVNFSYIFFVPTMNEVAYSMDIRSLSHELYDAIMWIGLLVGGIVAQITGARVIVIFAGVVSIVAWITLGWISPNAVLQWMFYIVALAQGMMQAPAYVYLAEISQPNMRSALMAAICLSENIGWIYYKHLAGRGLMKMSAFVNVVFALFGLVVMFFLPESPYWLANKGRYHGVESSLAWFRGRTSADNVDSESKAIITNAQNSPTAWKLFGQRSLYIGALIVGCVFLANAFVRIFFTTFWNTQERLMSLGYHDHELTSKISLVFDIVTVLLSIAFVVLVAIIGKRIMVLISLFNGSIAILVASIAGYLSESKIVSTDAHLWFLLICPVVAYFSLITGAVPVPLLLNAELFPSKLRYVGAGLGLFLMNISSNRFYMHGPGELLILALASMIGFISLLWLFPRNDNKSLVEIEQSSKSISELRRKK